MPQVTGGGPQATIIHSSGLQDYIACKLPTALTRTTSHFRKMPDEFAEFRLE